MSAGVALAANDKGEIMQLSAALQKAVPIPSLNEGYFAEQFDEMTSAVAQVRAAVNLALGTEQIHMPPQLKQPASQ